MDDIWDRDFTPEEEAAAVERAAANYRAHVERIGELVLSKNPRARRPQHELDGLLEWVPALCRVAVRVRKAATNHAAKVADLKKAEEAVKVAAPPLASEPTPQPADEQAVLDL